MTTTFVFLYALRRKNAKFLLGQIQESAIKWLKKAFASDLVLAHYESLKRLGVLADASVYGLCAVIFYIGFAYDLCIWPLRRPFFTLYLIKVKDQNTLHRMFTLIKTRNVLIPRRKYSRLLLLKKVSAISQKTSLGSIYRSSSASK